VLEETLSVIRGEEGPLPTPLLPDACNSAIKIQVSPPLPYILVVVDEVAELSAVESKR
jgi:DNA segregation ATPase FtsK/SpoIIIE-like protein